MRSATLLALLPLAMAAPSTMERRDSPAPVIKPRGAQLLESKYIIKMKSGSISTATSSAIQSITADADYTYSNRFNGFAASLSAAELEAMRMNPHVEYIEQDAIITMMETQNNAPWGLARLSSNAPGSSTYTYDASAGEGTCAYIVDTGTDVDHPEFEGRATWLANFADQDNTDGQGHGTHVAGTVGSLTYGVAKKTNLFAVKVLDASGSGTNSGVIAGMEFVVDDFATQECPNGAVVNMSLGGTTSQAINTAAAAITDAGMFLAVAAGNESQDAENSSPASEPSACTVGATTRNDTLAYFSNFGGLVDVLAPGLDITSTWPNGDTNTISGTSMASPHVAGLGAYFLGLGEAAEGLCEFIAQSGLTGKISGLPSDTANVLINNGESA
jgi:subtilisin family serine protease